jgi:hypothetical protein
MAFCHCFKTLHQDLTKLHTPATRRTFLFPTFLFDTWSKLSGGRHSLHMMRGHGPSCSTYSGPVKPLQSTCRSNIYRHKAHMMARNGSNFPFGNGIVEVIKLVVWTPSIEKLLVNIEKESLPFKECMQVRYH